MTTSIHIYKKAYVNQLNSYLWLFFIIICTSKLNAQWEKMGDLYGGYFNISADKNRLIAYNWDAPAYLSKDTGKTWQRITYAEGSYTTFTIHDNKIYKNGNFPPTVSSDDGQTWLPITPPFENYSVYRLFKKEGKLFLITAAPFQAEPDYRVYQYNETTGSWDIQSYFPKNTIAFTFSTHKIYALTPTDFFVSDRNNISWVAINKFNNNIDVRQETHIEATDTVVTIVNGEQLYASKNSGISWNKPFGEHYGMGRIFLKNNIFYIKDRSGVYASKDNTTTWQRLDKGWTDNASTANGNLGYLANFVLTDSTMYATTYYTGIMSANIANENWQYLPTTPYKYGITTLVRVGPSLLAVSNSRFLYCSFDEGKTWKPVSSNAIKGGDFNKSGKEVIVKDSLVLLLGLSQQPSTHNNLVMLKSTDYGTTWRETRISASPSDTLLPTFSDYIFQGDTIYIMDSHRNSIKSAVPPYSQWQEFASAYNFTYRFLINNHIIISQLNGNQIMRITKDKMILPSPNFVGAIQDMIVKGNQIFLSTYNSKFYLSTNDSIFISKDNGLSWASKKGFTPSSAGSFFETFNDILLVSKSPDGIYISKNNGDTWTPYNTGLPEYTSYNTLERARLIDKGYIYVYFSDLGLYRRSLSDFNTPVKSLYGTVFNDENNNGIQESTEQSLNNVFISSKASKAYTTTGSAGNYVLYAEQIVPNDTIRPIIAAQYVKLNPDFYLFQQADTSKNFGVHYLPNIKDLSISATAHQPARPGFQMAINITVENKGTVVQNPTIRLNFDAKIQYLNASIFPTNATPQYLEWKMTNFKPFDKQVITINFKTPVDVNLNTTLVHIAQIEPIIGDTVANDNIDTLRQIVVGSFDPNDKNVNQNNINIKQLTNPQPLVYTIRFQNTGTYRASFVRIVDTLSPKLDISSIQILSSSHPVSVSLKGKGVLEFFFNDINLWHSSALEEASHGFVKYAVKPLTTLQLNDNIQNKAYIYFDYNTPIVTNTIESKIVLLNAITDLKHWKTLNTAPNPTNGMTYFQLPENEMGNELHLSIIDAIGKIVLRKTFQSGNINHLDLSSFNDGLYFIVVESTNKKFVGKILLTKDR